jgi:hypothetical protein
LSKDFIKKYQKYYSANSKNIPSHFAKFMSWLIELYSFYHQEEEIQFTPPLRLSDLSFFEKTPQKSASKVPLNVIKCICFNIFFWRYYISDSLNRTVTASPPVGGSGYTKHQSGFRPLWCFVPPHFFAPVKMLRIFPYRAQKNVSYSRNARRNNF